MRSYRDERYDELVQKYQVTYVAGGAAQNAARGAAVRRTSLSLPCVVIQVLLISFQYVLPPHSVVYAGCVGDDELADQLRAANKREGLDQVYQVQKGEKTGACGVIITGHNRSDPRLYNKQRLDAQFSLSDHL